MSMLSSLGYFIFPVVLEGSVVTKKRLQYVMVAPVPTIIIGLSVFFHIEAVHKIVVLCFAGRHMSHMHINLLVLTL